MGCNESKSEIYTKTTSHENGMIYNIREINIMKSIQHPNIMPCISAEIDLKYCTLNMPRGVSDMEVRNMFHLSDDDILRILYSLACTVRFLHQHHIIHCDIKPANIILFKDSTVKLTDFGSSLIADPKQGIRVKGHLTTWYYRAPEMFEGDYHTYNDKTDIWALGIAFLHIINNGRIFSIIDNDDTLLKSIKKYICDRNYMTNTLRQITSNELLIDLICSMLQLDPTSRLDIDAIINHKVFDSLVNLTSPLGRITKIPRSDNKYEKIRELSKKYLPDLSTTDRSVELANHLYSRSLDVRNINGKDNKNNQDDLRYKTCYILACSAHSIANYYPSDKLMTKAQFTEDIINLTEELKFNMFIINDK